MKEVEILGANRFETWTKIRAGSRAVIVQDGKILLSHETVSGWYLVPGGGMEEGETPEECCVREAEEETGLSVRPVRQFLTMMNLTEKEKRRGAGPEWVPLEEAVELFSHHQDYAETSEEKRGAYLREYTALQEYLKTLA